jgi:hypothetical protein
LHRYHNHKFKGMLKLCFTARNWPVDTLPTVETESGNHLVSLPLSQQTWLYSVHQAAHTTCNQPELMFTKKKFNTVVFESISSERINTQSLWLGIRVRRHFRFEAKWSETEAKFFRFDAKKVCFFCLFHIDAKRKNLKRNENGTKQKRSEKLP